MSNLTTSTAVFKALLSMNDDSGDILTPFEKLTEIILMSLPKKHFNAEDITKELNKQFNIKIDVLPMKTIFKRLRKSDVIEKKKNTAEYFVKNFSKCELTKVAFECELSKATSIYNVLMNECKIYLEKEFNVDESIETIEKWFQNFLELYANEISLKMTEKFKCRKDEHNKESIYISSFIIEVCLKNSELENLLKRITFGYILNKGVFFDLKNDISFDDLTIILDTPIIFKAVGITILDDMKIYQEMIKSFQELGGKVKVFSHTLSEIESILRGTEYWIDQPDYNPLKASLTSEYYIVNELTKADVSYDLINIRFKIKELGIEEIEVDYFEDSSKYNQSEDRIAEVIISNYRESAFKKDIFENSAVQYDAKSINGVYHLRKDYKSSLIQSSKAIFVTSNLSLVRASQEYNEMQLNDKKFISTCMSDIEIGTFIWLNTPMKIEEMSFLKMTSQVLSIMEPSIQLWNKFLIELEKCEKSGEITPENCYLLRSHSVMSRELVKLTMDDIEFITSETPNQILNKFKMNVILQEKAKSEEELLILKSKYEEEKRQLESKIDEENKVNINNNAWIKDNVEKKVKNYRRNNYLTVIGFYLIYLYLIINTLIKSELTKFEITAAYFGIILPIISYLMAKYIKQMDLIDKVIEKKCDNYRLKQLKGINFTDDKF